PRAAAIQALARTPGTVQLQIHVVRHTGLQCTRAELVRRDQARDCGFDEGCFLRIEEEVGGVVTTCRGGGAACGGRRRLLAERGRGRNERGRGTRDLEKYSAFHGASANRVRDLASK